MANTRKSRCRLTENRAGAVAAAVGEALESLLRRACLAPSNFPAGKSNCSPVSWSSKRQATVAASTTEAEYIAIAAAVREALWLRQLLKDLAMVVDTVGIFADNQGTSKLVKNPVVSNRSKHIDVVYHLRASAWRART